jgi:hypothetical protein
VADHLVGAIAEHALRGAVEQRHGAVLIDADDGVQCAVEDRLPAGLAQPQR